MATYEIANLIRQGNKLPAIKMLRERTPAIHGETLRLLAAKNTVEHENATRMTDRHLINEAILEHCRLSGVSVPDPTPMNVMELLSNAQDIEKSMQALDGKTFATVDFDAFYADLGRACLTMYEAGSIYSHQGQA